MMLILTALVAAVAATAPLLGDKNTPYQNEYIVVYHTNATLTARAKTRSVLQSKFANGEVEVVRQIAIGTYFYADHIRMSPSAVAHIREQDSAVKYVEYNGQVHANQQCDVQRGASWGLTRVGERDLKLTGDYGYSSDGAGTDAYVLDTGIYVEHNDFEGRAIWGIDVADNPPILQDANGHGTHVAGTIISKTYGVAKKATAIAVKVLGASGSGSTAGVISGVEWVSKNQAQRKKPSTANMSLGGGFSTAMNDAVNALVKAGVVVVVAAGNENTNACFGSPSSASDVMTVSASDEEDARSYFSNYGSCSNIFAPGSYITSTWIDGPDSNAVLSGTSMASPHVAGGANQILGDNPSYTPKEVYDTLLKLATENKIVDTQKTPNSLLYAGC
eukprot:m.263766 g.263766  ORF g.263766 m.263766 type:complete len:389 (+) comp27221_c0_seq1:169-1335(+)